MLTGLLTICLITCLSDLTPGPNFWKIVHHAASGNRRQSAIFILGLSSASALHCLMGLLGISALIASFEAGLLLIQLLGGGYIAWYGLRMLLAKKKEKPSPTQAATDQPMTSPRATASARRIFLDGVLTNFANPKTILFYASLFAMTLSPNLPASYVGLVMICLLLTSLGTNLFVACLFSLRHVRRFFQTWERAICRVIGGMLILGGLKIAFQPRG